MADRIKSWELPLSPLQRDNPSCLTPRRILRVLREGSTPPARPVHERATRERPGSQHRRHLGTSRNVGAAAA